MRAALAILPALLGACDRDGATPGAGTALPPVSDVPGLATLEDRGRTAGPAPKLRGEGFRIEDGPPLSGDPAVCATFHACCDPHDGQLTAPGLACGLAPAAGHGDCAKALQSVREIFREQNVPPPPGCM